MSSTVRNFTIALILLAGTLTGAAQTTIEHDDEAKMAQQRRDLNPSHDAKPAKITRVARPVYVITKTELIEKELFMENLKNRPEFNSLDLVMVDDPRAADVYIEVSWIPWTFDYVAKAVDKLTKVNIVSARIPAFNGWIASQDLAAELVSRWAKQRAADGAAAQVSAESAKTEFMKAEAEKAKAEAEKAKAEAEKAKADLEKAKVQPAVAKNE